ncbi:hypothetical protein BAY61_03700 [Prauserella marina]|uniref:Uncharacterized protein n=1 Tax=Prauserella marina TaxID=530584 RepID=A0A222VK88_9PSEU|nr:hypothetical protein [Prauserella marina]ASR34242.1 hypothetical protein BAY61_03700 [Prauserella marina]PWV71993.1 hypothetical protein DES30_111164 [Prauserella marina]SDD92749.1 hypothetical protein SAMN05421630_114163 [Prauserella marina]
MRHSVLAVVAALVWLLAPPAFAQDDTEVSSPPAVPGSETGTELPPKLDVPSALAALEDEQIYRAPGAVAYLDEELIRAELGPDMRILIGPFTGPVGETGNYVDDSERRAQTYIPLREWSEDTGRVLIRVEGLLASSSKGVTATPSDLDELRGHTAAHDVTDAVLTLIRHAKDLPTDSTDYPVRQVVAPTERQVSELAEILRRTPVYNAPGREDPIALPRDLIEERTGFTVRAAALPVLAPGEPVVDYAPALAEEFPGEVVLVAHGGWLDVAGPENVALTSARNYAFGRFQQGSFRQGSPMQDRIGTILVRADELLTEHPFGRPQPKTLQELISEVAPWVLGGSALVVAGIPLARMTARRVEKARAERAEFAERRAETFAELAALGEDLLAEDDQRDTSGAAERHATATTLFEQATTTAAMEQVRVVIGEGSRQLRPGRKKRRKKRRKQLRERANAEAATENES